MAESGYKRETENGRGGRYQGATAAKRQASLQDMGILNPAMAASLHTLAADSNVASERRSSKHASPSFGDASLPGRTRTGFDPRINSDALIYEKGPSANNVLKHIMIRLSAQFSELLFLSAEAQARFNQNRDNGDLDIAIHGLLKALYLPVPSHLFRAGAMGVLGECLAASYKESGRPRDIKESIRYCKGGLLLSSPDDQGQVALFTNLGCALNIAFEEGGNIEDLTEAIQSHRKALAIRSPDDNIIEKSQILMNLSGGLKELYEQTGVIRHLEEAIVNLRGVSPLVSAGHSRRPHFLINLAISLIASHEQNGSDRDLEEAISLLREALLLDQERASILLNLARCLHDRFHKKGKVEDLEEAVKKLSEAVDLHPAGHPSSINPLIVLGGCLNILHEQLGRIKDLEEGIRCLSLALKLSSPGSLNKALCLHNLGTCLRARYEHSNHFEDQDMAIQCLREALRLIPKSSSHHRTALQNLSHCLLSQHKRQGTSDALDEATRSLQETLHLYPPNHTHRPIHSISGGDDKTPQGGH
ncbi:hypothetical protein FRC02_004116 [Tulasnella sp. 418]|nr:hypothetical protein FRC02_004116 [Tulasnella sp. 418]